MSWALKYHYDVHWYTSGKHNGLIIANFTQTTTSGHTVYQLDFLLYAWQKGEETYILHIIHR